MQRITTLLTFLLASLAFGADQPIDPKLAAKAEVVIRAKRLSVEGGDKYTMYHMKVLEVFKNAPGAKFTNQLSVAAYSGKDGVPEGESTLYLVQYNPTNPDTGLWKLVGGEAATGVSHAHQP